MRHLKFFHSKPGSSPANPQQNMQFASQLSALIVSRPGNMDWQWQYRSHISFTFSLMIKTLSEAWPPHVGNRDSAKARRPIHTFKSGASECKTSNTCEEHVETCKVGVEVWPLQHFEPSKNSTIVNYQTHQTALFVPSTNESHEDDFDFRAFVDRADQRDQFPKQVHQSQHNHCLKYQINHGKVNGKIVGGDIPNIWGTIRVPRLAVATVDQERCPLSKSQQCRNVQETVTLIKYRRNLGQYEAFFYLKETMEQRRRKKTVATKTTQATQLERPHPFSQIVRQEDCYEDYPDNTP